MTANTNHYKLAENLADEAEGMSETNLAEANLLSSLAYVHAHLARTDLLERIAHFEGKLS